MRGVERESEADRLVDLVDEPCQAGQPADRRDRRAAWVMPTSGSRRAAAITLSKLMNGSPMPMKTQFVSGDAPPPRDGWIVSRGFGALPWSISSRRRKWSAWSRISDGRQIAAELHRARRAERARQRAAGLRRDADRAAAVAVAHQHRLDRMAVVGAEERLHGAVPRLLLVGDGEGREGTAVGERLRAAAPARSSSRRSRRLRARPTPRPGGCGRRARRGRLIVDFEKGDVHRPSVGAVREDPVRQRRRSATAGAGRQSQCGAGTTSTGQVAC